MTIKVLQINVDRRSKAQDLARATADSLDCDIIATQEPNRALVSSDRRWIVDEEGDTAVFCKNRNCDAVIHKCNKGYTKLRMLKWTLFNCYISLNVSFEIYREFVERLMDDIKGEEGEVLVVGDFNSKSTLWGAGRQDRRGEFLADCMMAQQLVILNTGTTPTFVRREQSSIIDISFCTTDLSRRIKSWSVLDFEALSV